MSFSRPANALANAWVISWSWPSPPPLSRIDTEASVCSVVGYVLARDSGITEPSLSSPLGRLVGGRRQLDVHGPQQAGLPDLGGAVGRQVHVAVDAHGHQRMPVLHLDLGDVADVDVGDPHPGVLLDDNHIGHLRLNGVRAVATAFGSGQAAASSGRATHMPGSRPGTRQTSDRGQHAPHGVPRAGRNHQALQSLAGVGGRRLGGRPRRCCASAAQRRRPQRSAGGVALGGARRRQVRIAASPRCR